MEAMRVQGDEREEVEAPPQCQEMAVCSSMLALLLLLTVTSLTWASSKYIQRLILVWKKNVE